MENIYLFIAIAFEWLIILTVIFFVRRFKKKRTAKSKKLSPDSKPRLQDEKAINILLRNYPIKFQLCSILDTHEAVFYHHAKEYAKRHDWVLFTKVRIADIIYVPGTEIYKHTNAQIAYAIQNKHFDFVFCRQISNFCEPSAKNFLPFLVVEIDGKSHESQQRITRDELINLLIYKVKSRGCNINLVHIQRKSIDDVNTEWRILKYSGEVNVPNQWLTVSQLLESLTTDYDK